MKSDKALVIYSFLACLFLMLVGIFTARTTNQLLAGFIYLPLVFYFGTRLFEYLIENALLNPNPAKRSLPTLPVIAKNEAVSASNSVTESDDQNIPKDVADKNKRLFLQLIGTTGISLLIMALFSKKARDTFLGGGNSVTEVVGIKDSEGKIIDPSKEHPTDGYSVTDIDDEHSPAYYGFVKKDGSWYVMQNVSGTFRYVKGASNYQSNWDVRDKLHFDYYNHVFS